jgi:hypothetical protein
MKTNNINNRIYDKTQLCKASSLALFAALLFCLIHGNSVIFSKDSSSFIKGVNDKVLILKQEYDSVFFLESYQNKNMINATYMPHLALKNENDNETFSFDNFMPYDFGVRYSRAFSAKFLTLIGAGYNRKYKNSMALANDAGITYPINCLYYTLGMQGIVRKNIVLGIEAACTYAIFQGTLKDIFIPNAFEISKNKMDPTWIEISEDLSTIVRFIIGVKISPRVIICVLCEFHTASINLQDFLKLRIDYNFLNF